MENNKKFAFLAWFICFLGAIYYSYEYFLRISPSVMDSDLREHFGLSATGFGTLSAMYYYAYVPMQLPVGILMDRFGPRRLISIACLICVIGTFMFGSTNSYVIGGMGRFLVGFGSAFAFVGVLKLATIWLPEDKLGMVAGMATALGTIGAILGDHYLGSLVQNVGWQNTVTYSAYLGIGLIFVLWFGIRDQNQTDKPGGTIDNFKRSMQDLLIIARNKQIWINGLFGCLVYLPTTVFAELWGIPYFIHAHGMSHHNAEFANMMLFLGFTIGAPSMGYLSDKLHLRKLPMVIGATVAAIIMMIILYVPNLSVMNIYCLMFTLGLFYSAQAIVFVVGRELSPNEAAGTAIAMTNMIVMLGAMFIQPLVGRLLDWSLVKRMPDFDFSKVVDKVSLIYTPDDYQFALSVIPIGILIAAILTFFLKETHAISRD